jgi:hypothetical protein
LDCRTVVTFLGIPIDATYPSCGLRIYVTEGEIGRYPNAESLLSLEPPTG